MAYGHVKCIHLGDGCFFIKLICFPNHLDTFTQFVLLLQVDSSQHVNKVYNRTITCLAYELFQLLNQTLKSDKESK